MKSERAAGWLGSDCRPTTNHCDWPPSAGRPQQASVDNRRPAGGDLPVRLLQSSRPKSRQIDPSHPPYVNGAYPTTLFSYTADGLPQTVTDPLGRVTTFSYDTGGRLLSQTEPDPDGAGALLASTQSFVYDARDQVTGATHTAIAGLTLPRAMPASEDYAFDGTGNRNLSGGSSSSANGTFNRVQWVGGVRRSGVPALHLWAYRTSSSVLMYQRSAVN